MRTAPTHLRRIEGSGLGKPVSGLKTQEVVATRLVARHGLTGHGLRVRHGRV